MVRNRREGSDSRCCQPSPAGYVWRDYRDNAHASVVAFEAWFSTLTPWARAHEEGVLEDLMEAAARGELKDSGDATTPIKPIALDPEIFELRHKALSKALRFYHGEPAHMSTILVHLHAHIKTTAAAQQAEIEFAADRFDAGRRSSWV
ncbi:hypothetical protein GW571_14755 (plasmid) [Clavibacter capsici]|uniref:Uncharacterized protein n=1 Tax=Clavibacter capsici TaxID=1874630 RepID=A0A0M4HVG5_9MICO|nr:hypothetical protein AES38_15255 [Clavibacter capsici]QIS40569.1 hypothetical protein GW572_15465 [Clavibacter capsici]QIS43499.1 hypothetical protein GW571_14755 [Clavibacter capsici]QIS46454.1 hypothetical protein GW570_14795 [Clavibacter capsici]